MQKIVNNSDLSALAAIFAMRNSCDPNSALSTKQGIKGVTYVKKGLLGVQNEKAALFEALQTKLRDLQDALIDLQFDGSTGKIKPNIAKMAIEKTQKAITDTENGIKATTRGIKVAEYKLKTLDRAENYLRVAKKKDGKREANQKTYERLMQMEQRLLRQRVALAKSDKKQRLSFVDNELVQVRAKMQAISEKSIA